MFDYVLQKAEALLTDPRARSVPDHKRCKHCASPDKMKGSSKNAKNPDDPLRMAMNERYDVCGVIPGQPGCCVRCIWRNNKQGCVYLTHPFEVKPKVAGSTTSSNRVDLPLADAPLPPTPAPAPPPPTPPTNMELLAHVLANMGNANAAGGSQYTWPQGRPGGSGA